MFQITFADRMRRLAHNTEEFAFTTGWFPESVVADLLTDLRIWCVGMNINFDVANEQSCMDASDELEFLVE